MKKTNYYLVLCVILVINIQYASAIYASDYDFLYDDNLDTRNSAQKAAESQSILGYTTNPVTNSVASDAFLHMPDDNIFFFNGHGNAGFITFAVKKSCTR